VKIQVGYNFYAKITLLLRNDLTTPRAGEFRRYSHFLRVTSFAGGISEIFKTMLSTNSGDKARDCFSLELRFTGPNNIN